MYGLKHQKEKRSMDHFAGLDVSVKETSVCIVDDTGRIVREVSASCRNPAMQSRILLNDRRCRQIESKRGPDAEDQE
jgi:transposase